MKKLFIFLKGLFVKEAETLDERVSTVLHKYVGIVRAELKEELSAVISKIKEEAEDKLQEYKIDIHNEVTDVLNGVKKEKTKVTVYVEKIVDELNAFKNNAQAMEQKEIDTVKQALISRIEALAESLKK
jgi:hypothetical protein